MALDTLRRSVIGRLPQPLLASFARLQNKGVRRIFRDGDIWIHETDCGYFAYPQPYLRLDLRLLDQTAKRNFFWGYTPQPGDIVVDIGAGVGEEALTFARAVAPHGKVICVEAHPRTFRCIEALIRYNRLPNVSALQRAITQPARAIEMIDDCPDYLLNRLGGRHGFSICATTVDGMCRTLNISHINFLKMNIEGAERLALRGVGSTLKHTDVLCICCHDFLADKTGDNSYRTKHLVCEFLHEHGFRVSVRSEPGGPVFLNYQVWAYRPRRTSELAS